MIKNEHQYQVTKSWAEKFSTAIESLHQNEEKKNQDLDGWQLLLDSYQSQMKSLQDEIAEYEALISHDPHQPVVLKVNDFSQISDLLIKARIALKISQKELAYLCDRTEEQIHNYEEKDYQNASFIDFLAVSDALGIQIQEGQFFAQLHEFYQERLTAMRESYHLNAPVHVAS